MFTGIIEEIGRVRHVISGRTSGQISIQADTVLENTRPGDSIAVNGVCLTAAKLLPDGFIADVTQDQPGSALHRQPRQSGAGIGPGRKIRRAYRFRAY